MLSILGNLLPLVLADGGDHVAGVILIDGAYAAERLARQLLDAAPVSIRTLFTA